MSVALQRVHDNDVAGQTYQRLMQASSGLRNVHLLASMLASQVAGLGDLPSNLGLPRSSYESMLRAHFPSLATPLDCPAPRENGSTRDDERQELRSLLMAHRVDQEQETVWMADIVVSGCMGTDHLWQDLGLWSRQDLSQLMQLNFPTLAQKNDRDMKWKKFLYKQLCIAEGIYVCRSPSCEACPDYDACFGPEE